jgi:hypothetical protein
MIARRRALAKISLLLGQAWALVSCTPWRRDAASPIAGPVGPVGPDSTSLSPAERAEAARLENEVARLSQRSYSDQGIVIRRRHSAFGIRHLAFGIRHLPPPLSP